MVRGILRMIGLGAAGLFAAGAASDQAAATKKPDVESVLELTVTDIDGKPHALSQYRGKVVVIVNVASRCGFTKQYKDLQQVYERFADDGLVVIGFPSNDFGRQEPGSNAEIKAFCSSRFNVTFPMMAKVSTKGAEQSPVYAVLTSKEAHGEMGGDVRWNFTKFLIGRDGKLAGRFEPGDVPTGKKMLAAIETALKANAERSEG